MAFAAALGLTPVAFPQPVPAFASPPVAPVVSASQRLSDAQLQTLLAPIALYPDALLAQILPASTYPLQVVTAGRFLQANPHPTEAQIDAQDLEPPLKALLHYPTVVAMMSDRLLWTQTLGAAFLDQQPDVLSAVQELRQQARNAGALNSTPQQEVVTDDTGNLGIVPADTNQLYVPDYDPGTIYDGNLGSLNFGLGYPEGFWLDNSFDWHHRWIAGGGGWHHGWDNPIGDPTHGNELPLTRPWARDHAQPIPVRSAEAVKEIVPRARPGYETPAAGREAPGAFGGYQQHAEVQRQQQRAAQSREFSHPTAQQAQPAREVQQARPAQVFHASGPGRSVAAQSARGNASRAASSGGGGRSGGGGGGGHAGGGGGRR
jgi:uncharacterized membrane protein YgcG